MARRKLFRLNLESDKKAVEISETSEVGKITCKELIGAWETRLKGLFGQ